MTPELLDLEAAHPEPVETDSPTQRMWAALRPRAFAERERLLSQSTGVAGFEPATTRLTVEGSAAELHAIGGGGRIRTCDLQVMSLASYRTALLRDKRIERFSMGTARIELATQGFSILCSTV